LPGEWFRHVQWISIVCWVDGRTSALMSAAQQMAMSTAESSSFSSVTSFGDAMIDQVGSRVVADTKHVKLQFNRISFFITDKHHAKLAKN
jgi:hypothetical protein